jgi:UDP-N-acetylmuramoyl-L-alanine---L-glutamate ligase
MFSKTKNYLDGKKILILGLGREGLSTYKFVRKILPNAGLTLSDKKWFKELDPKYLEISKKDKHANFILGSNYLKTLSKYDVVIKTPGIPNKLKEIKEAMKKGVELTSQTKIFFEESNGLIIGVTGTKGKSTTASLIYHILKTSGEDAILLGNIGKPALDYLKTNKPKTIYVFEMSSHQLSDMVQSPDIAVLLNIFPEHLDYYESFEGYFKAKKNITNFQGEKDYFIYNFDDKKVRGVSRETKAKTLSFSSTYKKDAFVSQQSIFVREGKNINNVLKTNILKLKGTHNLNNVMAAILAAKTVGVKLRDIKKGIKTFEPLPVRIEELGLYRNIVFVLDALATIPEATMAALNGYNGKVGTLICGGFDRGQNFKELAKEIVKQKVDNLVLFPTTGAKIWREVNNLKSRNKPQHFMVDNMEMAVKLAYEHTPKGKVCLLSAASSSFSVFKNYEEEAYLFRKYVKDIGSKK